MPGNAHQSVHTAAQDADFWSQQRGQCVYLAQGIFRNAGAMGPVYPKAIRQEPNLIACKNLYMDVDVKKGAYANRREALGAIKDFILQSKLPWPNLLVGSGNGGVHVYWTLDAEFEPKEFRRMAAQLVAAVNQHGLIIDQQCTSDPVRLMRMVGTWNFKYATDTVDATPVTLLFREPKRTSLNLMQKALAPFKPTTTNSTRESKSNLNDDLSGGMKRKARLRDIDRVAEGCPLIRDALADGGADLVGEPIWHDLTAVAHYCVDPEGTVVRLIGKSQYFNPDTAMLKLNEVRKAREGSDTLGFPRCATLERNGAKKWCETCKYHGGSHKTDGTGSPLNTPEANATPDGTAAGGSLSEDALARRFAAAHAADMRYVALWGKWLIFDGKVWKHDDTMRAFTRARAICRDAATGAVGREKKDLLKAATVAAVERLARSDERLAATSDQWDRDIWLLNTPDGVVDLRTGAMRENAADDYTTRMTSVAPLTDDKGQLVDACPKFLEFLEQVFPNDPGLHNFLQRLSGYAATGSTREHVLAFGYGTGRNGKGTLISILAYILGDYHKAAEIETFLATRNERHSTELARLAGARFVTASEPEDHQRWATARVKKLTGGDPVTARFMRQDDFEYSPQFLLCVIGNHKPSFGAVDPALRDRLLRLSFNAYFAPDKCDRELLDKLKAEADGILSWLIKGAALWLKDGLAAPPSVLAATEAYLASEDLFAQWIDDYCVVAKTAAGPSSALYASWRDFAEAQGERAGGSKWFRQTLEARGYIGKRATKGVDFEGLDLTAEEAKRVAEQVQATKLRSSLGMVRPAQPSPTSPNQPASVFPLRQQPTIVKP
jgi:putative DNA primase/helicase